MSNRYNINESLDTFQFYQCPKDLFLNEEYSDLCNDAKVLYMLMYDTNKLSIMNNWVDKEGYIFIHFSLETIVKLLNVGKTKAVKLKKDLVNKGLIEEVRQGLSKPNVIYINKVNFNIQNYRVSENENQEFQKMNTNNNENNKNKNNNNNISMVVDDKTKERIDYTAIKDKYNNIKGDRIAQCKNITPKRKKQLNARISEYGIDAIYKVLDNINESDFLKNKFGLNTKDQKSKLDFEWIFNPNNFIKILEDKYKDRQPKQQTPNSIDILG